MARIDRLAGPRPFDQHKALIQPVGQMESTECVIPRDLDGPLRTTYFAAYAWKHLQSGGRYRPTQHGGVGQQRKSRYLYATISFICDGVVIRPRQPLAPSGDTVLRRSSRAELSQGLHLRFKDAK